MRTGDTVVFKSGNGMDSIVKVLGFKSGVLTVRLASDTDPDAESFDFVFRADTGRWHEVDGSSSFLAEIISTGE